MPYPADISIKDSADVDAFSRLRVSSPQGLFDGQFTYNLLPLQYEPITAGTGAAIAHDTTNRCALLTLASTPSTGKAIMQSYEYVRYQPGRSQAAFVTFNFIESVTGVIKFAGLSDGVNGVEIQQDGASIQIALLSASGNGNQIVPKASWNIDQFVGTGISGLTLDLTKTQILVVDLQALYVGRVRVGFDIGGVIYYAHEFRHANVVTTPYIQYASLPVRCGMTCSATASTTMRFICAAVVSEGGQEESGGVPNVAFGTATAGFGTDTHLLSVRPKTTFNGLSNRVKFVPDTVDILANGTFPVRWKMVVGQAISGTVSYSDVSTAQSAFEFNTAGTLSGTAALVVQSGYIASTGSAKGNVAPKIANRIPITLDAAGAIRANGTISILVQGIGGTVPCLCALNWRELR